MSVQNSVTWWVEVTMTIMLAVSVRARSTPVGVSEMLGNG
jgi:hypothetical protein